MRARLASLVAPLLLTAIAERISLVAPASRPALIIGEIIVGSVIGLMGRFYLLSLQFAATAVSSRMPFSLLLPQGVGVS